jgi:hypothetical protein
MAKEKLVVVQYPGYPDAEKLHVEGSGCPHTKPRRDRPYTTTRPATPHEVKKNPLCGWCEKYLRQGSS